MQACAQGARRDGTGGDPVNAITDRAAYRFRPDPAAIERPTILIKCDCQCTWIVVKAGLGLECISQLKRQSRACPRRHEAGEDR